jgi:hypothetical protein
MYEKKTYTVKLTEQSLLVFHLSYVVTHRHIHLEVITKDEHRLLFYPEIT